MTFGTYNMDNGFEQPKGSGTSNPLFLDSLAVPYSVGFSIAAAGANVSEVTLTLKDGHGNTVARALNIEIWLSDAATGLGITATTASGTVTAKASSGTVLSALTAKKHLIGQTKTDGTFILEITDTAKTGFYVAAKTPITEKISVSSQLATASYGA